MSKNRAGLFKKKKQGSVIFKQRVEFFKFLINLNSGADFTGIESSAAL